MHDGEKRRVTLSDTRENAGKNPKSLDERYEKLRELEAREAEKLSHDRLHDGEKRHVTLSDARENSVRAEIEVGKNYSDGYSSYEESEEEDEEEVLVYFIGEECDGNPIVDEWENFLEDMLDQMSGRNRREIYRLLHSAGSMVERINAVLIFLNEITGRNFNLFTMRKNTVTGQFYDFQPFEKDIESNYSEDDYFSDSDSIDSENNLDYNYHRTELSDAEIEFAEDVDYDADHITINTGEAQDLYRTGNSKVASVQTDARTGNSEHSSSEQESEIIIPEKGNAEKIDIIEPHTKMCLWINGEGVEVEFLDPCMLNKENSDVSMENNDSAENLEIPKCDEISVVGINATESRQMSREQENERERVSYIKNTRYFDFEEGDIIINTGKAKDLYRLGNSKKASVQANAKFGNNRHSSKKPNFGKPQAKIGLLNNKGIVEIDSVEPCMQEKEEFKFCMKNYGNKINCDISQCEEKTLVKNNTTNVTVVVENTQSGDKTPDKGVSDIRYGSASDATAEGDSASDATAEGDSASKQQGQTMSKNNATDFATYEDSACVEQGPVVNKDELSHQSDETLTKEIRTKNKDVSNDVTKNLESNNDFLPRDKDNVTTRESAIDSASISEIPGNIDSGNKNKLMQMENFAQVCVIEPVNEYRVFKSELSERDSSNANTDNAEEVETLFDTNEISKKEINIINKDAKEYAILNFKNNHDFLSRNHVTLCKENTGKNKTDDIFKIEASAMINNSAILKINSNVLTQETYDSKNKFGNDSETLSETVFEIANNADTNKNKLSKFKSIVSSRDGESMQVLQVCPKAEWTSGADATNHEREEVGQPIGSSGIHIRPANNKDDSTVIRTDQPIDGRKIFDPGIKKLQMSRSRPMNAAEVRKKRCAEILGSKLHTVEKTEVKIKASVTTSKFEAVFATKIIIRVRERSCSHHPILTNRWANDLTRRKDEKVAVATITSSGHMSLETRRGIDGRDPRQSTTQMLQPHSVRDSAKMISDPEIEILCGEYKNSYKEIVNANNAVRANAKNAKSLDTYELKCESEISENNLTRKDKIKDSKIDVKENNFPCEKELFMKELGLKKISVSDLRLGDNIQEKLNSSGNTKNLNVLNEYEKEQFEVRSRVYKDINNLVQKIKNPKLLNFKENKILYDLVKLNKILNLSQNRQRKFISLERLSICDRVKIYNKYFGCNFKTNSKDKTLQEMILTNEGPMQKSPDDPGRSLKRKEKTSMNDTIYEKIKSFDSKDSGTPLNANEKDIRKINFNRDFKLDTKSVQANTNFKNSFMRQVNFDISNDICANHGTTPLEAKNNKENSQVSNIKLPFIKLEKIEINLNQHLANDQDNILFNNINLQNKKINSLTDTHLKQSDTNTLNSLKNKVDKDLKNLKFIKLPSNSKYTSLDNKSEILDTKFENKKKPTLFIANKTINISKKHVNIINLSIPCEKYLDFMRQQLSVPDKSPKLETTNQRAGQVTREREDIQSDPKTKIQDGRHSRVIERTERSRNKVKRIVEEEMESENEKKQRIETEDELVYDYLTDITLEAVNRERSDRLAMLTRLTEKQKNETRPTRKEAEDLLKKERQRTAEINQAVFVKMQSEKMSRTFYNELLLPDESGDPEFEVTSIISIKKLKEDVTSIKPIYLNIKIDGEHNTNTIRYGEEDNFVTTDDESEGQTADPTQNNDKENRDGNIPKVIENIQIKPPDKKYVEKEIQEVQILKTTPTMNSDPPIGKVLRRALCSRQNPLEGEMRPEDEPSTSKTGQEAKSPILRASRGKTTRIRPEFRKSDSDSDWEPVRRRKVAKSAGKK